MNQGNFTEKIYSNNNNILIGVLEELQQILNISHENLVIKRIGDIINTMKYIINENKKNTELIINHIINLENKIESKLDKLNINNNQELKLSDRRYIGQVINGLPDIYKKNTNFYNISKRVPSWTDRILYKNNENITSLYYDRVNLTLSDHKPIVGFFEIKNSYN